MDLDATDRRRASLPVPRFRRRDGTRRRGERRRWVATLAALAALMTAPGGAAYKILSDFKHFQLERRCEVACFASAETKVEAIVGETVDFECRVDRRLSQIRRLWTTDGGEYVADDDASYKDRFLLRDKGDTLRLTPVKEGDNHRNIWCNLMIYDSTTGRWNPRKTLHHFLFVGEGTMPMATEDLINLDIEDASTLYHHRTVDELDSEQKHNGSLKFDNVTVENIFYNGTMEKDTVYKDAETDRKGAQGGNVREEKQFLDLGKNFENMMKSQVPPRLDVKNRRAAAPPAESGAQRLLDPRSSTQRMIHYSVMLLYFFLLEEIAKWLAYVFALGYSIP